MSTRWTDVSLGAVLRLRPTSDAKDTLSFDLGVWLARSEHEPEYELRAGLTFTF
jgi:hypothetical protein